MHILYKIKGAIKICIEKKSKMTAIVNLGDSDIFNLSADAILVINNNHQ
jgi:hypothetical protein